MQIIADDLRTIELFHDDVLNLYDTWDTPIVIVSDGAYGIDGGGLYAGNTATLNGAELQGNACAAAGCTSGGVYATSHLTLTQVVTTVDDIEARGNWWHNGNFIQNGGAVTFRGATTQIIAGSAPVIFASLAISNTGAGVYLGQNITVTNRLTLTTDLTTTANYTLNLTEGATSAGSGDVWGNTARRYTFAADTAYSFGNPNVSLTFGVTSALPSGISVASTPGAPDGYPYAVSRTYTITVNGGGTYSATVRLHYQDSELGYGEAGLKLMRYNGSAWENQGSDAADTTANWVEKSGIAAFSPWALANRTPTAITLRDFRSTPTAGLELPLLMGSALLIGCGAWLIGRRRRRSRPTE